MKQLHALLTNVLPDINTKLNSINHGGCGHFAYQLHMALAARDIPSSIVLVNVAYSAGDVSRMIRYYEADNINQAYHMIINNPHRKHSPCIGHLCLVVDHVLYDSDGMSRTYHAISDAIDAPVLKGMLDNGRWNPYFVDHNGGDMGVIVPKFKCFFDAMLAAIPVTN